MMTNNIVVSDISMPMSRHIVFPSKFAANALCSRSDTQFLNSLEYAQQATDDHTEHECRQIVRLRSGTELEVTISPYDLYDVVFLLELGGRAYAWELLPRMPPPHP